MPHEWTKSYHGVQHYGKSGATSTYSTITDYGKFTVAYLWYPGCQFHPHEFIFPDAATAREKMAHMVDDREGSIAR